MKTTNAAVTTAVLLLMTAISATARGESEVGAEQRPERSIVVRYTSDALERQAGREALNARIASAARRACGSVDIKDFQMRRLWQECYDAALADALDQVADDQLTASRR